MKRGTHSRYHASSRQGLPRFIGREPRTKAVVLRAALVYRSALVTNLARRTSRATLERAVTAVLVSTLALSTTAAADPLPRDGAAFHREAEREAAQPGVPPSVEFGLPIELGQGFKWKPWDPIREYTWSGGVVPTFRWGRVDLGLDVAAVYRNPDWDAAIGPRLSAVLAAPYEVVAIKLGVEGDYLPSARSGRTNLVVTAGLGTLAFIRAVAGFDFDQQTSYFLVGLGFDPLALADPVGSILRYGKTEDVKP